MDFVFCEVSFEVSVQVIQICLTNYPIPFPQLYFFPDYLDQTKDQAKPGNLQSSKFSFLPPNTRSVLHSTSSSSSSFYFSGLSSVFKEFHAN
jgi:hypothetical protein